MPCQPSPPKLVLYGPDTRYGARKKPSFKRYLYYIVTQHKVSKCISTGIEVGKTAVEQKANRLKAEAALLMFMNEAANKQAAIIQGKFMPTEMLISECLRLYVEGNVKINKNPLTPKDVSRMSYASISLLTFFSGKMVSEVNSDACLDYALSRKDRRPTKSSKPAKPSSPATIRREFGVLNAAINFCVRKGHLTEGTQAELPPVPDPMKAFLRRHEVAALLSSARKLPEAKDYLPDFILFGTVFGARRGAALDLQFNANALAGYVDFEGWFINFQGARPLARNKVRALPPIPRKIRRTLLAWRKKRKKFVFEHNGRPIVDPKKSFRKAARAAAYYFYKMSLAAKAAEKLGQKIPRANQNDEPLSRRQCLESALRLRRSSPHILRHTCITWLLQAGFPAWKVGGFVGDTEETISRVYGHHCPGAMKDIADSHWARYGDRSQDQGAQWRSAA